MACAANFRAQNGEMGAWNQQFTRSFNDWEMDQLCSLVSKLHEKRVIPKEMEKLVGNLSKAASQLNPWRVVFSRKLILNPYIPRKKKKLFPGKFGAEESCW